MSIQLEALRRRVAERPRPLGPADGSPAAVVVGSGKGGVGTSLVAALLAVAAAAEGRRVLLVDADAGLGFLHLLFGVHAGPGLGALRGGATTADELVVPLTDTLSLLPGGGEQGAELGAAERQALFRRVAPLFGGYDLTLIDGGSRLRSVLAACGAGATRLLAVTTRDRIAVTAAYALIKAVGARCPELPVSVLVNRDDAGAAEQLFQEVQEAAERFLQCSLASAGAVPEDPSLQAGIAAGMPLHEAASDSPAAAAAERIVRSLAPQHAARAARHHLHRRQP